MILPSQPDSNWRQREAALQVPAAVCLIALASLTRRGEPGLKPAHILSLFSVQTFVNLVRGKQDGRSA